MLMHCHLKTSYKLMYGNLLCWHSCLQPCDVLHWCQPRPDASQQDTHLLLRGACTLHPKSAILSSPFSPSSRFSGLMSLWITCFEWQYARALDSWTMYLHMCHV
jgi:hypothetical protein